MKSSRMKIAAVLLTASFMLAGCGEQLCVLTPEEEAIVVGYAAHAVAKYNTFQQDGEVFVQQDVVEEETTTEENVEDTQEQETEETEQNETEITDETDRTEATDIADGTSTLTEALDLGVIRADYVGSDLCTTYEKSDSHVVDADPGQQLLVLKINLVNQINQDLHIDILAMVPTFKAIINGTEETVAQTTILTNDLSTYQSDILSGGTNETVLLFQIPQEIEEISTIQLKITMNDKNYTVNL